MAERFRVWVKKVDDEDEKCSFLSTSSVTSGKLPSLCASKFLIQKQIGIMRSLTSPDYWEN